MEPVSQFQKQILAEMGIVSWKLRADDEQQSQSSQAFPKTTQSVTAADSSPASKTSGLSGLELIKQQMANNHPAKVDVSKSNAPNAEESKPKPVEIPQKTSEVPTPVTPSKPVLEYKSEILVWQSKEIPLSDLILAFEAVNIPYQLVDSDSAPVNRFPLLIASQKPENLVADKMMGMNTAMDKKQLWQALQAFTHSQGNAS